jgi:hypothetical protein
MATPMIRIRNNGTVRELKIPKNKLEMLEKIVASPYKTDENKKHLIKKHAKASPCCICRDGIPAFEIRYPFSEGGASRVEYYCSRCIEQVYSRESVL